MWLRGPRITAEGNNGFNAAPVRLNIDDLLEILDVIRGSGTSNVQITGRPYKTDPFYDAVIDDITKVNPVEVTNLTVWARTEPASDCEIRLSITPDLVQAQAIGPDAGRHRLDEAIRIIQLKLMYARRGPIEPHRWARLGLVAYRTTLVFITFASWAWLALSWHSWPGRTFTLVVACIGAWAARGSDRNLQDWLRRHQRRVWLDPTSRAQIYSDRANTHRDIKAVIIGGVPLAILTGFITWLVTVLT